MSCKDTSHTVAMDPTMAVCDCARARIAELEAKLAGFERAIESWKKEEAIWHEENAALRSERDAAVTENAELRRLLDEHDERRKDSPLPIGTCPRCQTPVYSELGSCGRCNGW